MEKNNPAPTPNTPTNTEFTAAVEEMAAAAHRKAIKAAVDRAEDIRQRILTQEFLMYRD